MAILRIEPPMWLEVVGGDTPKGLALCHFLFDDGAETNICWGVIMNEAPYAGEFWQVENRNIRFCRNMTLGRPEHGGERKA